MLFRSYQSTAVLIQEADGGTSFDGGGLLRTLAGGNFPSGGSNLAAAASGRVPLPPSMYPVIIASTDFQQDLIHEPVSLDMFNEKIGRAHVWTPVRWPTRMTSAS